MKEFREKMEVKEMTESWEKLDPMVLKEIKVSTVTKEDMELLVPRDPMEPKVSKE